MVYSPLETSDNFEQAAADYSGCCEKLYERISGACNFEEGIQLAESSKSVAEYSDGVYFVTGGQLSYVLENTTLLYFEQGDVFSIDGLNPINAQAEIRSDFATNFHFLPEKLLEDLLGGRKDISSEWTRLLVTSSRLFATLARSALHEQTEFTPVMLHYENGDVILKEGESGDEVFTMVNGTAEVYASDTLVGEIADDEIFGALAAFAGMKRTATVKATSDCTVLSLPKERFVDLIRTRPTTISKLVEDLARKISHLNEKVIDLTRKKGN